MRIAGSVRHVLYALAALLLAGTLAACSGGVDRSSSSGGEPAAQETGSARDTGSRTGGGSGGSGGTGRGGAKTGSPARLGAPDSRAVVYTARLRVRAGNIEQASAKAKQAAAAAGGYVENESSTTEPATARLVLKIPADRYAGVLDELGKGLGEKLSLRQEAEDVTEEVADVESRVRSAEATLASFRKLLDRASTVGEVINVEEQIATRQADLEALQARQKSLQQRTRYATVSLSLVSDDKGGDSDKDEDGGGFLGGLKSGWDAFTGFLSGLALVVGWLLPFLALAAVIAVPAYLLRRRLRGNRPERAQAREAAPEPAGEGPAGEGRAEAPGTESPGNGTSQ